MERAKNLFIYYYKKFFESKIGLIKKIIKLLLVILLLIFLLYNWYNYINLHCINYLIKKKIVEIKIGTVLIIITLIFYAYIWFLVRKK